MNRSREPAEFGPYRLVRPLGAGALPGGLWERWVGVDRRDGANCTLYRLGACHDSAERRRVLDAIARAASVRAAHTLAVREFAFDAAGSPWIVTPYTGNHEGLVTLGSLVRLRGGLSVTEVLRAIGQVLETAAAAHARGVVHGPMGLDEVQVDRHGSVRVELYGLSRALRGLERASELVIADEVRSIAGMAYTILTAQPAEEPRVRAGRLVPKLPRELDEWIETGLDPFRAFVDAAGALAALRLERPASVHSAAPSMPGTGPRELVGGPRALFSHGTLPARDAIPAS